MTSPTRRRLIVLTAMVGLWSTVYGEARDRFPEGQPFVALVHDAGLSTSQAGGLVFALWADGTLIRERDPNVRSDGDVLIGRVDEAAVRRVKEAIQTSRLWHRSSAPRYLDLPEDGLVIREGARARCWYDTPPFGTTVGLRTVADVVLGLSLASTAPAKLDLETLVRWGPHRERACR